MGLEHAVPGVRRSGECLNMLLQTNSYIVPKDKRAEHARLMARFRQCFRRLGSGFEVYEQTGPNWAGDGGGRFVQMMRFRDRRHQAQVAAAEKADKVAQQLIADFCRLVNLPYQQQQGLFAGGFYAGVLPEREADASHLPSAANEPTVEEPGVVPSETGADEGEPIEDDEIEELDTVEGDIEDEADPAEPDPSTIR